MRSSRPSTYPKAMAINCSAIRSDGGALRTSVAPRIPVPRRKYTARHVSFPKLGFWRSDSVTPRRRGTSACSLGSHPPRCTGMSCGTQWTRAVLACAWLWVATAALDASAQAAESVQVDAQVQPRPAQPSCRQRRRACQSSRAFAQNPAHATSAWHRAALPRAPAPSVRRVVLRRVYLRNCVLLR